MLLAGELLGNDSSKYRREESISSNKGTENDKRHCWRKAATITLSIIAYPEPSRSREISASWCWDSNDTALMVGHFLKRLSADGTGGVGSRPALDAGTAESVDAAIDGNH